MSCTGSGYTALDQPGIDAGGSSPLVDGGPGNRVGKDHVSSFFIDAPEHDWEHMHLWRARYYEALTWCEALG